jgi:ferritin-like metal-binding protein YciE
MGLFSRDIKSLEDLFNHALKDIYYAEHQILKTLPTLIDNATEPQLKKDLKQHLKETEGQVARLDKVFELLGQDPKGTRCPAIDGILSEGDSLLGEVEGRSVTNAAIVFSAQAVEHYEITRYGGEGRRPQADRSRRGQDKQEGRQGRSSEAGQCCASRNTRPGEAQGGPET